MSRHFNIIYIIYSNINFKAYAIDNIKIFYTMEKFSFQ